MWHYHRKRIIIFWLLNLSFISNYYDLFPSSPSFFDYLQNMCTKLLNLPLSYEDCKISKLHSLMITLYLSIAALHAPWTACLIRFKVLILMYFCKLSYFLTVIYPVLFNMKIYSNIYAGWCSLINQCKWSSILKWDDRGVIIIWDSSPYHLILSAIISYY
jgi:hypothetical protein